jgi:hypothetical protein
VSDDEKSETFEEACARLGIEPDDDPTSTVVFLGPRGAAAVRAALRKRERRDTDAVPTASTPERG